MDPPNSQSTKLRSRAPLASMAPPKPFLELPFMMRRFLKVTCRGLGGRRGQGQGALGRLAVCTGGHASGCEQRLDQRAPWRHAAMHACPTRCTGLLAINRHNTAAPAPCPTRPNPTLMLEVMPSPGVMKKIFQSFLASMVHLVPQSLRVSPLLSHMPTAAGGGHRRQYRGAWWEGQQGRRGGRVSRRRRGQEQRQQQRRAGRLHATHQW